MEKNHVHNCIGLHETQRAAAEGKLQKIILAEDADAAFRARIHYIAQKHGIPVEDFPQAADLGRKMGIEVKAGVVGVFHHK